MSNAITLSLTPRDPLIARDGRPFVAGLRMKSLDWFYPAVVAGSLRTMLGNLAGGFASNGNPDYTKQVDELKSMQLAGPFPSVEGKLYFPFPHDVEVCRNRLGILEAYGARPVELANAFADTGCDLPVGLEPVLLPELNDQFKPETKPAFISTDIMAGWLVNDSGNGFPIGARKAGPMAFCKLRPKIVACMWRWITTAVPVRSRTACFKRSGLISIGCRAAGVPPKKTRMDRRRR